MIARRVEKRIEYVRRQKCYSLEIELSSVCNARCIFCPLSGMKRSKRIMDDETFQAILDRAVAEGIRPPLIDLSNVGEPLADRSLFKRIRQVKSIFPAANVRITTNFGLANDAIVDGILQSGLDSIHISVNAASAETHLKVMGLNFENTVANIRRLIERRNATNSPLHIMVSMVLCKENAAERKRFLRDWSGRADSICLQRAVDWGGAVAVGQPYHPNRRLYPCNDLFERIVILSNGELALCCQDAEGIIHTSVRERPILEISHSRIFETFREKHLAGQAESLNMCKNCFAVHSNGANWLFAKFD
ncbi:MAG TPA: radical SAM/SPASM domain-containing protein [Bryobacteraceae bacterium]|nr:radical SAM/SPASM domain-containing protein [Bryobacteraceae bacterium]